MRNKHCANLEGKKKIHSSQREADITMEKVMKGRRLTGLIEGPRQKLKAIGLDGYVTGILQN